MKYTYEWAKEILSQQGATLWSEALAWAMEEDIRKTRNAFENAHGTDELLNMQGQLQGKLVLKGIILGLMTKGQ